MAGQAVRTIVLLVLIAFISGCGQAVPVQRPTVKAEVDVKVTDPVLKELVDVTKEISIVVSGEFAAGAYFIDKTPLTF